LQKNIRIHSLRWFSENGKSEIFPKGGIDGGK